MSANAIPAPYEPHLITELPGPKTKALIAADARVISPSYTRGYPLSMARGEGAMVFDADGNRFLDFCAGIAVCATGHSHPDVVAAITKQAQAFIHMSGTDFYYDNMVRLAERLVATLPGASKAANPAGDKPEDLGKVYFGNSGTEAIEAAIKLAKNHTGRTQLISFYRSFHGRTMGSMSLGASKAVHKKRFAPLMPGVHHAHYPYFYRDIFGSATPEECAEKCLDFIREFLFKRTVNPDEVAAFVVEPVQGEGGYVVPPANFLPGLQKLAREHGILIISDEIQSGIGRTGKMWASEHFPGFEPDIIASAKGLASGMPLGAIIARPGVMDWTPGTHASTFGGNPLACAAGLATLDLVEGCLMHNAQDIGDFMLGELKAMMARHDIIGDVRGLGLMIGVEIVQSKTGREVAYGLRNDIVDRAFYEGLVILGCGENTIRFCPPLIITREQAQCALDIFERVLAAAAKSGH